MSPFVTKLGAFATFLVVAVIVAGLFGALHDQISYSVSHEYFTKFKFVQFAWAGADLPARVRVAEIGFLASWWMGIPLGLFTGLAGFIHPDAGHMKRALWISLPVIVGCTLLCAPCGLLISFLNTAELDLADYPLRYIPPDLEQPRRFICAGTMHNFAYAGGAFSIPIAWLFHAFYRRRCRAGH